MPNTNFVPNWTFERTLPSPFDSYSGKSAVMKDIASKYCNQPKNGLLSILLLCRQFFLIWIWKIHLLEKQRKNSEPLEAKQTILQSQNIQAVPGCCM